MKAAGVLFLLFALAAPGFAQAPDDKLIVPGQRIGKWTLAMTVDDLVRMNGPRNGRPQFPAIGQVRGGPGTDLWAHRWDNLDLVAVTLGRESQRVLELAMLSGKPGYKTDNGIGVGSSRQAVQSAYGPPTAATVSKNPFGVEMWTGCYDRIGLAVRAQGDVAQYVSVFRPGTAKQLYKF
jgi:hypothetical protein